MSQQLFLYPFIDKLTPTNEVSRSRNPRAGWGRLPWVAAAGTPAEVLERAIAELEEEWPVERVAGYLDGLGQ
ncbi:hypothetical protein GCM10027596_40750 [Nocardioides korecus]